MLSGNGVLYLFLNLIIGEQAAYQLIRRSRKMKSDLFIAVRFPGAHLICRQNQRFAHLRLYKLVEQLRPSSDSRVPP